ncbi:MAG: hypothetical protein FRX49_09279 [Trebouxia sp. A1-2]|nr:MAG: hypothetical protein FRX49_09279 [Trebouxia sp. A1-2]
MLDQAGQREMTNLASPEVNLKACCTAANQDLRQWKRGGGRQLPVELLHAVHDVELIIGQLITILVLAVGLQGKGYHRQPLASTNQGLLQDSRKDLTTFECVKLEEWGKCQWVACQQQEYPWGNATGQHADSKNASGKNANGKHANSGNVHGEECQWEPH